MISRTAINSTYDVLVSHTKHTHVIIDWYILHLMQYWLLTFVTFELITFVSHDVSHYQSPFVVTLYWHCNVVGTLYAVPLLYTHIVIYKCNYVDIYNALINISLSLISLKIMELSIYISIYTILLKTIIIIIGYYTCIRYYTHIGIYKYNYECIYKILSLIKKYNCPPVHMLFYTYTSISVESLRNIQCQTHNRTFYQYNYTNYCVYYWHH